MEAAQNSKAVLIQFAEPSKVLLLSALGAATIEDQRLRVLEYFRQSSSSENSESPALSEPTDREGDLLAKGHLRSEEGLSGTPPNRAPFEITSQRALAVLAKLH